MFGIRKLRLPDLFGALDDFDAMKSSTKTAVHVVSVILGVISFIAFFCAFLLRGSEAGLMYSDSDFNRTLILCIAVGTFTLLAALILPLKLRRPRKRKCKHYSYGHY